MLEALDGGTRETTADTHLSLLTDEFTQRWSGDDSLVDAICRYALLPSGKLLRPLLLIESTLVVGGRVSDVVPAAIGTECGHVASLIHDDIIDADDMRRGRMSVPSRYGLDHAIVSGDALLFHLFLCLAECEERGVPADHVVAALRAVAQAGLDLCKGQTLETQLQGDLGCDVGRYITMVSLKTGALFRGACVCGALLAGATEGEVNALAAYGDGLGIAFQMHDDVLPFTSTTAVTGKDAASDLSNRRPTLPVLLARDLGGASARDHIDRILADPSAPGAFPALSAVVHETGAVDEAHRLARRHAEQAQHAVRSLRPSPSRDRLAGYAELAVSRCA